MSGEVVRIDNMYLAILIKKELDKKGIKKNWDFKDSKKKN